MYFEFFSDIYYWQSLTERDWYDDEFYKDSTYGLKRIFHKGTDGAFTVSINKSGSDGVWKWTAWKGEDDSWFDHHMRCGYEGELFNDVPGYLFVSMRECYDALVANGWLEG